VIFFEALQRLRRGETGAKPVWLGLCISTSVCCPWPSPPHELAMLALVSAACRGFAGFSLRWAKQLLNPSIEEMCEGLWL